MHLKLASREDVDRAVALASWLDRPGVRDVAVLLPGLDPAERTRAATRIRRLYNDCGCAAGMVAFLVGTVLVLIVHVAGHGWAWSWLGIALGAGVGAAVAGKFAGLAWSRWRLRGELRRLGRVTHFEVLAAP